MRATLVPNKGGSRVARFRRALAQIISCCQRRSAPRSNKSFSKLRCRPQFLLFIFSGLRLGLIFALLGVVGAELIAAEHGLGQTLAYLQSTFSMDGVMGLLFLLAFLGLGVTTLMNRLERSLLDWQ